jgi:hypothetical protein
MYATKELPASGATAGRAVSDFLQALDSERAAGTEGLVSGGASAAVAGIRFLGGDENKFLARLDELALRHHVTAPVSVHGCTSFALSDEFARCFVPQGDTLGLCQLLDLDTTANPADLEREIVLAMLAAPQALEFPSYEEFLSAVRVRCNIVRAARRTQLAFGTAEAERPAGYWQYVSQRGFIVLPGKPLIEALEKATQPESSGQLFSFSCYRATEYVLLLGIAQEMATANPALLDRLQAQWETRAIMSGEYHDVFLREYGSIEEPLPQRYYVPGDRVWFRNPDERSADASGYEGSWVIYLGDGLFSNFWKRDQPYSFTEKCVEIFHWRHGVYIDEEGEPRIDESIVEAMSRETLADPERLARILGRMQRYRDSRGVYAEGGCIDTSREFPRRVCVGTAEIELPGEQS